MRRAWISWLIVLAVAAVGALAARVFLFPRPLPTTASPSELVGRFRIGLAGLVLGAGFGLAAVGSQAGAGDHRVDATLAGSAWGALPGLLVPLPLLGQTVVCLLGASVVAQAMEGSRGLGRTLASGLGIAGLVVGTLGLGLVLAPDLTPTTADALLEASLAGGLDGAGWARIGVGGLLVLAGLLVAVRRWRPVALARAGLASDGQAPQVVAVLASAGAVLVAGVAVGLGLLAALLARRLVGEDPRMLAPGAALGGIALGLVLDGLTRAIAWPGELPLGVATILLASLVLAWEGVGG